MAVQTLCAVAFAFLIGLRVGAGEGLTLPLAMQVVALAALLLGTALAWRTALVHYRSIGRIEARTGDDA